MLLNGMYTEGWIFDVEILVSTEKAGIRITEVPNWHEVEGPRLN